ncbi:MAG: glycerol-3-phosphate dehydrogenase/oxidase [Corynebacterium sp.]|nr:glycerol-3-phosphate dehydrogenase/oxidase [Corynebacterium sp.]
MSTAHTLDPYAAAALNGTRRAHELAALQNSEVDLIIIGGGITGVGIALDAASRGLSTVLLEKHDLAFGTSRWSSKLAHGGLRYLTKLQVGIAHNSAVERGVLMSHTAPHLVRALPQVAALGADTTVVQKIAMRAGFLAGDALRITAGTSATVLPRSHYASPRKTRELCPAVSPLKLRGAWVNYDGQMIDDARVVTALARTAAEAGATILTYCDVREATGDSVEVHDRESGETFSLRAQAVIAATGVWVAQHDRKIKVRPSRGTHIVVDADTLGNPTGALTVPLEGSISRYLFILPEQHNRCYIGLTDEESPGAIPDVPPTPEEDITFLLDGVNRALDLHLQRSDVRAAFTGLRPLIDDGTGAATADLSRRHAILEADSGLISVTGGKFTEYRLMAEETLDYVIARRNLHPTKGCHTKELAFVGAPAHAASAGVSDYELSQIPPCIVHRFGAEAVNVVAHCPVARPLEFLPGFDVTRAEVAYAFSHEGALYPENVVDRCTRIGLVPADRQRALPLIADIATEMGIDAQQQSA